MPGWIFVALESAQQIGVPRWCEHASGRGATLSADTGADACAPYTCGACGSGGCLGLLERGPAAATTAPSGTVEHGCWPLGPVTGGEAHLWGQAAHLALQGRLGDCRGACWATALIGRRHAAALCRIFTPSSRSSLPGVSRAMCHVAARWERAITGGPAGPPLRPHHCSDWRGLMVLGIPQPRTVTADPPTLAVVWQPRWWVGA